MPIDFRGRGSQWSYSCAREQKNYEMNKCLSLVHLTSRIGSQSSGWHDTTSWSLRCPNPVFCTEAQLSSRQPLAQDTSAEASHKPVYLSWSLNNGAGYGDHGGPAQSPEKYVLRS
jgi:hypothetical protein